MALTARLISGARRPVAVEVDGHTGETGTLWLHRITAEQPSPGLAVHQAWQVVEGKVRLYDDGNPDVSGRYTPPPTGEPLTYKVSVYDGEDVGDFIDVAGTPVTLTDQPWPLPRLALEHEVTADAGGRSVVAFTVTNAKTDGPAKLDPGDGTGVLTVTLSDGTGTVTHRYTEAGHHTYGVTVTAPCPALYATWGALAAAQVTWGHVRQSVDTWADTVRTEESDADTVTVDVGPATVWAQVIEEPPLPAIQVNTWVADPGNVVRWTVDRITPAAGADFDITVWDSVRSPDNLALIDREAPLGRDIGYRLTLHHPDGTTTVVTTVRAAVITGTRRCFLTATRTGRTVPLEIQSWDDQAYAARRSLLAVVGRPDPVALHDVHTTWSGTLTLLTRTREALDELRQLLGTHLVLLRTQPNDAIESAYLSVGDITVTRLYASDEFAWERLVSVGAQHIRPIPATARESAVAWSAVARNWPTWGELPADLPTWGDVGMWNPGVRP